MDMKKHSAKPKDETPIIDHTIWGIEFTDTELLLKVGYYRNCRQLRLPLSRFSALAKASSEDRRSFAMHRCHTVIYWHRLKEKLVAKDVELLGASTERKADDVSERDFIYAGEHPPYIL